MATGIITSKAVAGSDLRGLGLSLASWFAVQDEARAGRLAALRLVPRLVHQRAIVLRKDKPRTPALAALLETIQETKRQPAPPV